MVKSQIDPAKEKQLQGAQITEFEYNVNRILKLIRDGDLDMDGTQEERDELIKDIYNQYISYRDHPEKEEELSASKGPKTEVEDRVKRILKLIKDGDLDMDGTPEEILKREPLAEFVKVVESIINELNVLQNKVESLQHQKSDLEAQNVEDRDTLTMEIEKLKLEMSTIQEENSGKKAKLFAFFEEESDKKLGDLKLKNIRFEEQLTANKRELNTLKQKASDYENQISAKQNKISQLAQENLEQEHKLDKLGKGLSARTKECSALQRKLNVAEKDVSGKITAFTAEVDNLQKDLHSMQKTKEEVELNCEKLREEKKELANEVMDYQRTLEGLEDTYQKLNEDYKQVDSWVNECKVELEGANRKVEEREEELCKWIESINEMVDDLKHQAVDLKRNLEEKENETRTLLENVGNHEENLRLSTQKLLNTEQLLREKEESFRKVEEELQQVQREFHEHMEAIMKLMKGGRRPEEVDESER
ncbi:COP1-interactive protein [Trifolium repens]|nr:COP1-interactive protein [Trifolium repens]